MRRAARLDDNHKLIKNILITLLAGHVTDSSRWGEGAGDLFVSWNWYGCFIEIKSGAKKKLTIAQEKFKAKHPHQWHRVNNVDHAIAVAEYIRDMGNSGRAK